MTVQNPLDRTMQFAQGLSGLQNQAQLRAGEEQRQGMLQQEQQQVMQSRIAGAEANKAMQDLLGQYAESGDPAVMRQIIMTNPDVAQKIQQQLGVADEAAATSALNEGATFKRMLETDPAAAIEYYQANLEGNPTWAGLADNLAAGDVAGAINEIGYAATALGGEAAYEQVFGGGAEKSTFISDLMAAGIDPKSEEGKAIILEKYGKGNTVAYDVVEGLNPETGKNEFFQVSRVNPGERVALGLEVPVTAAQIKKEAADAAAAGEERTAITGTLSTITKILQNPGLSGFSGLDSFKRFIPGSEAANVSAYIEQLQSQNFLTAVSQMKGMGALSENEGKKIGASVAAIDPSMSDDAILSELKSIEADLLTGLDRIDTGNLLPVTGGTASAPRNTPKEPIAWGDM